MFPSKIKRRKWDDDYVCFFFMPEVKNRAMSRLLNACFAILKQPVFGTFENAESFTKEEHLSKQGLAFFQAPA